MNNIDYYTKYFEKVVTDKINVGVIFLCKENKDNKFTVDIVMYDFSDRPRWHNLPSRLSGLKFKRWLGSDNLYPVFE